MFQNGRYHNGLDIYLQKSFDTSRLNSKYLLTIIYTNYES